MSSHSNMRASKGDSWIMLCGASLAFIMLLLFGMFAVILVNGLGVFWPSEVYTFTLADGSVLLGEVVNRENATDSAGTTGEAHRIQIKRANRDFYGSDFIWIDESTIVSRSISEDVVLLERLEWGNFLGSVIDVKRDGTSVVSAGESPYMALRQELPKTHALKERVDELAANEMASVSYEINQLRFKERELELEGRADAEAISKIEREREALREQYAVLEKELKNLRSQMLTTITISTIQGQVKEIPLAEVVRAIQPNSLSFIGKVQVYASRLWEFLAAEPREANTEGGVFPAIFGTVLMVILMSIFTTPLGVIAAIYLREYATQGKIVSAIRIAVNNLAGVPSIVFGVFGVGFFIYAVGGSIDSLFYPERLPAPTYGTGGILWASLTLSILTLPTVIVATEEGLSAIPRSLREASYALGATKWETMWKVVIPSLTPAILTGVILAVARAAGEVAPLMITGVVKLAPSLPFDSSWPFFHLERKFMHLGFHIYDVGFQSPNSEAAKPMVFMTTILLLGIVILLNLTAVVIRNRLRKRYSVSAV